MRMPVRSEADAFRVAWGGAVLIAAALALGALVDPLVGVALIVGGVAGVLVWEVATKDPAAAHPLGDALAAGRRARDGKRRLLVVANETMCGKELRDEIMRRGHTEVELRVVAPVLPSRTHYMVSDIDSELAEAQRRLDATLAWASEHGFEATGRVGDMPPVTAIEDELRSDGADELVISTHPPERSHWLESNLVRRAREELDIPVTHVVVDQVAQRAEIAT